MLKPLADRVLIRLEAKEEKTKSGIFLPDTAKENLKKVQLQLQVLVKYMTMVNVQLQKLKLATLLCSQNMLVAELEIDGATHLIISERDILAVL